MQERIDRQRRDRTDGDRPAVGRVSGPARRAVVRPAARPTVGLEGGPLDPATATRIKSSVGTALDPATRAPMERAFGRDLSAVRIHQSPIAHALAARAFTLGTDVHFAPGEYQPGTSAGRHLLAHELAHVVQQDGGGGSAAQRAPTSRIRRSIVVGAANDPAERQADRLADQVVAGVTAPVDGPAEELMGVVAGDGVVRRRIDMAALDNDYVAANDTASRNTVVRTRIITPWTALFNSLAADMPRRNGYRGRMVPLATTASNEIAAPAYNAVNALAAVRTFAREFNVIDAESKLSALGVQTNFANQAAVQNLLGGATEVRHDEAQTFALPARANALATARTAATTAANVLPAHYDAAAAKVEAAAYLEELHAEPSRAPEDLMKIGTEFTFTSDAINELNIGNNTGAHFLAAIELIKAWAPMVPERPVWTDAGELGAPDLEWVPLNWHDKRSRDGPADRADQKSAKFTYTLPSGATWWWQLNIDYQCIETQTQPTTRALYGGDTSDAQAIGAIVTGHIFGIATSNTIGLATHATIGGGHITLDRATTFGDNARWLRNFLVLYANNPDNKWSNQDQDVFNAPMIHELKSQGKAAFRRTIRRFDDGEFTTANAFVNALYTDVFKKEYLPDPVTEEQIAANPQRRDQPAHYQATNIEKWAHLDPTERRLEMRRFDAQADLADLLANIDAIVSLVKAARQPGTVALNLR